MGWLKQQLKRGQTGTHNCNCGKYGKNGKGLYCFKHNYQTPDK